MARGRKKPRLRRSEEGAPGSRRAARGARVPEACADGTPRWFGSRMEYLEPGVRYHLLDYFEAQTLCVICVASREWTEHCEFSARAERCLVATPREPLFRRIPRGRFPATNRPRNVRFRCNVSSTSFRREGSPPHNDLVWASTTIRPGVTCSSCTPSAPSGSAPMPRCDWIDRTTREPGRWQVDVDGDGRLRAWHDSLGGPAAARPLLRSDAP